MVRPQDYHLSLTMTMLRAYCPFNQYNLSAMRCVASIKVFGQEGDAKPHIRRSFQQFALVIPYILYLRSPSITILSHQRKKIDNKSHASMQSTHTITAATGICPTGSSDVDMPVCAPTSINEPSCTASGLSGYQQAFSHFVAAHPDYRDHHTNAWYQSDELPDMNRRDFLSTEGPIAAISFNHRKKGGYSMCFPAHSSGQTQHDHTKILSDVWNTLGTDEVGEDEQLSKLRLIYAVVDATHASNRISSVENPCRFVTIPKGEVAKMANRGQVIFHPGSVDFVPNEYSFDGDNEPVRSGSQWAAKNLRGM